jgi:hypothetical protein
MDPLTKAKEEKVKEVLVIMCYVKLWTISLSLLDQKKKKLEKS